MVEETILTIRETENEAKQIVEKARLEGERIRTDAQNEAAQLKEKIIEDAHAQARAEQEKARLAGEETKKKAKAEIETAAEQLKASAKTREKEAVEKVLSLLT